MSDFNRAILMGNLVRDPEIKYTPTGGAVTNFTVASNRGVRKDGESMGADFVNVTAWGRTAENVCAYLYKGSKVLVEGSIRTEAYERDGKRYYHTKINAFQVHFIKGKTKNDVDNEKYPTEHMKAKANAYMPEDDYEPGDEEVDVPL